MSSARASVGLASVPEGWAEDDDAEPLVAALARRGVDAVPAMWDDEQFDWAALDMVVVRSTWDYARRPADFIAWARRVARLTRLENPAPVIEWNIDKRYLGDLADAGVPVVPTTFLAPGADDDEIAAAVPPGVECVVKPTISAGSRDTARHAAGSEREARAHASALLGRGRDVMVQPYLDSVDRLGETGIVCFDGRPSHAFRKGQLLHPGSGPAEEVLFVREDITPREPAPDELETAERVLAAATSILGTGPLLYARVDLVRDHRGAPTLLELELVEPSFFLTTDPGAADRAADAIVARL